MSKKKLSSMFLAATLVAAPLSVFAEPSIEVSAEIVEEKVDDGDTKQKQQVQLDLGNAGINSSWGTWGNTQMSVRVTKALNDQGEETDELEVYVNKAEISGLSVDAIDGLVLEIGGVIYKKPEGAEAAAGVKANHIRLVKAGYAGSVDLSGINLFYSAEMDVLDGGFDTEIAGGVGYSNMTLTQSFNSSKRYDGTDGDAYDSNSQVLKAAYGFSNGMSVEIFTEMEKETTDVNDVKNDVDTDKMGIGFSYKF